MQGGILARFGVSVVLLGGYNGIQINIGNLFYLEGCGLIFCV